MVKKEKKVETPQEPKSEAQKFADEYNALCAKYNLRIIPVPSFKARDDGTFSTVIDLDIARIELPKQK